MKKYRVEWLERQTGIVWAADPKDAERQTKEAIRQSKGVMASPSTLTSVQEVELLPGESWKP